MLCRVFGSIDELELGKSDFGVAILFDKDLRIRSKILGGGKYDRRRPEANYGNYGLRFVFQNRSYAITFPIGREVGRQWLIIEDTFFHTREVILSSPADSSFFKAQPKS